MTSNRIPDGSAILILTVSCGVMACGFNQPLGSGEPTSPRPGAPVAEPSTIPAEADASVSTAKAASQPVQAVPTDPTNRCPCSRALGRLLPPAGWTCPAATGATASASIGPAGGSVSLVTGTEGVPLDIFFPPGALSELTVIKVSEVTGPTPSGFTDYSLLYAVEPSGLSLKVPASLRLPWAIHLQEGVTFLVNPALAVYTSHSAATGFEKRPDSYTNAGFNQASLDQLGYLLAGYPTSLDPAECTTP
jgi:hypothetical protein